MPFAALLILFGLWAATSVSFTWSPAEPPRLQAAAPPSPGRTSDIAETIRSRPSTIDYRRIDERLQQLIAKQNMVGLAVGIVENGEIRFLKGYGVTEAGGDQPVDSNTIFRWASLSKGVAGDMVAKLANQGQLSLYEPVGRYAASLRLPGGNEYKATISDLLSHRLGIFAHAQDSKLEDGQDVKMLRGSLATLNAICPPGQCHAYQNVAYDAAAEIVEKVTGKSYEKAVQEQLFGPLGMRSATINMDGLVTASNWAKPHRGGKNSKPLEVNDNYYRVPAAGGVNSSIKDLAVWMLAQMGGATGVLPEKVLDAVQSPRAITPGELARKRKFRERIHEASYGLGWRIFDYDGERVVGHHGGVAGYRSLIMFDPEKKSGVVALWNSGTSQPVGLEFEVMDMIYELEPRDWLNLGKVEQAVEQPEDEVVTDSGS